MHLIYIIFIFFVCILFLSNVLNILSVFLFCIQKEITLNIFFLLFEFLITNFVFYFLIHMSETI